MSITFTISAAGTNIVNQSDIGVGLSKTLTIENFVDDLSPGALISDYTFDWYFIDKPQNSTCSLDTSVSVNNQSVILNAIDTWGTYRIFCIAKETANAANKSNDNPLRAEESSFVNIIVKSSNNLLEKPASFQRNWKSQYDNLVDVVDNTTKRINNLKVSNTTTFTLPNADGTAGQILSTNGSGLLSFVDLDLSGIETNLSIDSLTDVISVNPQDGQALVWNTDHWAPSDISSGEGNSIVGITSDENAETLTISNGYSLIPDANGFGSNDIGSIAAPFNSLYATSLDVSTSLLLGDVLYTATDGQANHYLKTDGQGTTTFSAIDYSEISNVPTIPTIPTIETLIGGSPTAGQLLKWNDANSSWVPGDVSLNLSVVQNAASGSGTLDYVNDTGTFTYTPPDLSSFIDLNDLSVVQNAASGNGTLVYNNTNGVLTYTPPDLSNLGGGGGGSLTNWTENASGHIVPNANATYDIGESENKVRHLYLSDNSLYIGDNSVSLTSNSNIINGGGKNLSIDVPSISLKSYNFENYTNNPEEIGLGNVYRIESISENVDFTLVGALRNEEGHIFTATANGTDVGLVDDSIATVRMSFTQDVKTIYVDKADQMGMDGLNNSLALFFDGSRIITINENIILDGALLSYNQLSNAWGTTSKSSIASSIDKTWTASYDNEWNTSLPFLTTLDENSFYQYYNEELGPSPFIFAFKNTTNNDIYIKKVSLSCLEMHSSSITWSIAKASDTKFKLNSAVTLSGINSAATISRVNANISNIGIGESEITYSGEYPQSDSIATGEWFLIVINSMQSTGDKRFVANVYYQ